MTSHFRPSAAVTLPAPLPSAAPLSIGLPSGSLQEPTLSLFAKAGYQISGASRSYKPAVDDPDLQVRLLRAQEISRYVEEGFLDAGLTGRDWIEENGSDVEVLGDLPFSKASAAPTRWVLAVPNDSPIRTVRDLQGKRIATEAVGLTRRFLEREGVTARLEFSWGATEVKVPDLVDAIVDITETGSSPAREQPARGGDADGILSATHRQPDSVGEPLEASEAPGQLMILLQGALAARDKVGLKMNISKNELQNLLDRPTLPSRTDRLAPRAARMGGRGDGDRRESRARNHSSTQIPRCRRHHRISAEQGRLLARD